MGNHPDDSQRGSDQLGVAPGHQWVADHARRTLNAGLAVLEGQPERNKAVKPEAFFAFSVNLR